MQMNIIMNNIPNLLDIEQRIIAVNILTCILKLFKMRIIEIKQ